MSCACARTVNNTDLQMTSANYINQDGVLQRVKYKLCMMMRRRQDDTAPQYLAVNRAPVSETASRQHLRSAASHQLTVPSHRRITYGGRAFAVAGRSTWNSLPKRLHDFSFSISVFGCFLKTFLFSEYSSALELSGSIIADYWSYAFDRGTTALQLTRSR